jgi:hypothetical protein
VAAGLSSSGYPVAIASGASPGSAGAAWLAWVLGFAAATLGVQALLARSRGEPRDPGARSALAVAALALLPVGLAARTAVPWAVPAAVAPLALAALAVIAFRPSPRRLKRVGWTILSASLASAAMLVAGLR